MRVRRGACALAQRILGAAVGGVRGGMGGYDGRSSSTRVRAVEASVI